MPFFVPESSESPHDLMTKTNREYHNYFLPGEIKARTACLLRRNFRAPPPFEAVC